MDICTLELRRSSRARNPSPSYRDDVSSNFLTIVLVMIFGEPLRCHATTDLRKVGSIVFIQLFSIT